MTKLQLNPALEVWQKATVRPCPVVPSLEFRWRRYDISSARSRLQQRFWRTDGETAPRSLNTMRAVFPQPSSSGKLPGHPSTCSPYDIANVHVQFAASIGLPGRKPAHPVPSDSAVLGRIMVVTGRNVGLNLCQTQRFI